MPMIQMVHAREVLDSRGTPTVEVDVRLTSGALGRAIVPSGASTGRHEAVELRDGDARRYRGKGVRRAVDHVNRVIGPTLVGHLASDQRAIDQRLLALDGTPNKGKLGANALLGVSLAVAHAAAADAGMPLYRYLGGVQGCLLPMPMVNIISGGLHAGGNVDLQDYLVIPVGARRFSQAMEMVSAVYWATAEVLAKRGLGSQLVADEGGHGPAFRFNEEPLEVLAEAVEAAGLRLGDDIAFALDVASTHFFMDDRYHLLSEGRALTRAEMADLLFDWVERYPIISIEDGMAENDWEGWALLTQRLGSRTQLIGDDLFTTNPARLARGISTGVANSVLVKVNQIGTLTETLATVALAQQAGYKPVISARSGETEDATIADLAVATRAGQIKIGSITRSERLAKYNQLLRIEDELGAEAPFAGRELFPVPGKTKPEA